MDFREEDTLQGDNKYSALEASTTVALLVAYVVEVPVPVKGLRVALMRPTTKKDINIGKVG